MKIVKEALSLLMLFEGIYHVAAGALRTSKMNVDYENGKSSCTNPSYIGEIRNWKDKTQCIHITGDDGLGNVQTNNCDDFSNQIFKFCEDGTIRSAKSGFCLDVSGHRFSGQTGRYMQMGTCEPYVNEDQRWDTISSGTENESGISQELFKIKNRMSGNCLDIAGRDGSGDAFSYPCDDGTDQIFYVRSRGEVIGHGRLQNQESGHCLNVNGQDGRNVATYDCHDSQYQTFTLYENGELVNAKSNWCIDIGGKSGDGNIGMYACEAFVDQQWTQGLRDGSYFSLVSKRSSLCLDVAGGDGRGEIQTSSCDNRADQKWKWIEAEAVRNALVGAYPKVNIINSTDKNMSVKVKYALCRSDEGLIAAWGSWTPDDGRGACLLTKVEATVTVNNGKYEAESYSSTGTSYSKFAVLQTGATSFQVTRRVN